MYPPHRSDVIVHGHVTTFSTCFGQLMTGVCLQHSRSAKIVKLALFATFSRRSVTVLLVCLCRLSADLHHFQIG